MGRGQFRISAGGLGYMTVLCLIGVAGTPMQLHSAMGTAVSLVIMCVTCPSFSLNSEALTCMGTFFPMQT